MRRRTATTVTTTTSGGTRYRGPEPYPKASLTLRTPRPTGVALDLIGTKIDTPFSLLEVGLPAGRRPDKKDVRSPMYWWVACLQCLAEWAMREARILRPIKEDGSGPRAFCLHCRNNARLAAPTGGPTTGDTKA
jgi:hypothetical protein